MSSKRKKHTKKAFFSVTDGPSSATVIVIKIKIFLDMDYASSDNDDSSCKRDPYSR